MLINEKYMYVKFKQLNMWTRVWLNLKLVGKHIQDRTKLSTSSPLRDLILFTILHHRHSSSQESSFSPQAIRDPFLYASDCSSNRPGKKDSPWPEDPVSRVRAVNLLVHVLIAFSTPRWRQTEIRLRQLLANLALEIWVITTVPMEIKWGNILAKSFPQPP